MPQSRNGICRRIWSVSIVYSAPHRRQNVLYGKVCCSWQPIDSSEICLLTRPHKATCFSPNKHRRGKQRSGCFQFDYILHSLLKSIRKCFNVSRKEGKALKITPSTVTAGSNFCFRALHLNVAHFITIRADRSSHTNFSEALGYFFVPPLIKVSCEIV